MAACVGAGALAWTGTLSTRVDTGVVAAATGLTAGLLWLLVRAEMRRMAITGEPPLPLGDLLEHGRIRRGRTGTAPWLRAGLAGAMVTAGVWGAVVWSPAQSVVPQSPSDVVMLRVEVPSHIVLKPSTAEARAALGLDEQSVWTRATVTSVIIREGTMPVFGIPATLATALGLDDVSADVMRVWPTRTPRLLGVAAASQPQSLDPRDAEAKVANAGAVPAAAALLPPGLLVTEATFARAFPLHEGPRYWLIATAQTDAEAIDAALRERLGTLGVVTRAHEPLPQGWRVR
jgi:hypothetical protein